MHNNRDDANSIWPIFFPEETLVIKRPCLRHTCQGNTDVGELLSYFLYEAGKIAVKHGVSPQLATKVVFYRFHDDILYCLDYSVAEKALARNIKKLEELGFLDADTRLHRYTIHLNYIRDAIDLYRQTQRRRPPQHFRWCGPPEVYVREASY